LSTEAEWASARFREIEAHLDQADEEIEKAKDKIATE
jgi:hypothetical protein